MLFICQNEYPHIRYQHNVANGGVPTERQCIATSGCGLCSVCMIVDHLTTKTLELEDAVKLSENNGANRGIGTNMKVLGPIVAEMYGLEMTISRDRDEMVRHLREGGEIIVNVRRGDRPLGLFTKGGHYMVLLSTDGKDVCLFDPDYSAEKFEIEGRKSKVRTANAPFLYCSIETLMEEIPQNGDPAFYMFKRK